MEDMEFEEVMMVSDISEGLSGGDDGGDGRQSPPKPVDGVRNRSVPPFVTNLYNIVNNKDNDSTISWVSKLDVTPTENQGFAGATSFAIWNETDFVNNVLPLMSRSKNFDSFITQLNNYGFKKISWDCREYANKWFQEGKPHLLKNIKRRCKDKNMTEMEKITREINKLESESKELDHELHVFKEYIDNAISKQKTAIKAIAKVIKLAIDQHHVLKTHETINGKIVAQGFAFADLTCEETGMLDESSFTLNCEVQVEQTNTI